MKRENKKIRRFGQLIIRYLKDAVIRRQTKSNKPKRQQIAYKYIPISQYYNIISISSKKLNYIRSTFATRNYEKFPAGYAAVAYLSIQSSLA